MECLGLSLAVAFAAPGAWLSQQTPIQEADYYLCGPRPFLRALVSDLRDAGPAT